MIISSFFVFQLPVKAITAPIVSFVGGDDIWQNGGSDDPYDSFIEFTVIGKPLNFTDFEIEYSNNGGDTWNDIDAFYTSSSPFNRHYYWSTSHPYAPTLLFRTRSVHGLDEYSEYYTATLALSHRINNPLAHYYLEDFTDRDDLGSASNMVWDDTLAHLRLSDVGGVYQTSGEITSDDILVLETNSIITEITVQPVHDDLGETIRYQFSNDGSTWYGPGLGEWLTFGAGDVPSPVNIVFNTSDDKLYWKVQMSTTDTSLSPHVFQLRIDWQENYAPQACFSVDPLNSDDTEQLFTFNGACSSDYEDTRNELEYRWDFDNSGEPWEIDWTPAAYTQTFNYSSTSTQIAKLWVRDTLNATDDFSATVNSGDLPSGIYGWAWSYNYGWASLNCDNIYYGTYFSLCPPDYGLTKDGNSIYGWAWDSNIGWICFGSTCVDEGYINPPSGSVPIVYDSQNYELTGWGHVIVFGADDGWLSMCQNPYHCTSLDGAGSLTGEAWNGFNDGTADRGLGWLKFYGNLSSPWLESKYGLVYGKSGLGSSGSFGAPDTRFNASYCIRTGIGGDIVNFSTESGCSESGYADFDLPTVSNQYWTIPGLINFNRIANSYDQVDFTSDDVDNALSGYTTLGNKVYNFTGQTTYTIDNPLTFYNARGTNSSGAGTVIINGDLVINSDMFYEEASVASQIENLASLTWIIKGGNVTISPSVSNIVGNFIVLDNGSGLKGKFYTGDDTSNTRQLTISGLVMAHEILLQRNYIEENEPAEIIIYDGRVIVNTPPGMDNVAGGLPVWREAMASTIVE